MKNHHYPFELLNQVDNWIEKNKPKPSSQQEDIRHELLKTKKLIKSLQEVGVEAPPELLDKRKTLDNTLSSFIEIEDMQILSDLKERLQELSKKLDQILRQPSVSVKTAPKRLRVKFGDGTVIFESTAVETFLRSLQHMGLERCAQCDDIIQLGHPVVAIRPNDYNNRVPGCIKELDGSLATSCG